MDWSTLGLLTGGGLALNALTGGGVADTLFGSDPSIQGFAQSPGQSYLQSLLQPGIGGMANAAQTGQPLYNVPQAPMPSYQVPQAPFSSPADFAGGYDTILNRMIEPFGESLGSARGGWSGAGQQVLGSAMREIAPQIMNQYTQSVLPYAQMQNQQGLAGYSLGQMSQYNNLANAYNPQWLYGMYNNTYGSPMINPGQAGAVQQMIPYLGLSYLMGGNSPLLGAGGLGSGSASEIGGLGTSLSNMGTRLGGYLGIGSGLAGETMLGTEAAQAAMSGTQAGTLSALGSGSSVGGTTGALASTAPAYSAMQMLGPVAAAATISQWGPSTLGPIAKGIGSALGMGKTTAPSGGDYLKAWLSGAPAGTDLGYGQTLPGSIDAFTAKSWIAPYSESVDPTLINSVINKDTNALSELGDWNQYIKYPDWYYGGA